MNYESSIASEMVDDTQYSDGSRSANRLWILVAIVLALALAVAAYFYFAGGAPAEEANEADQAPTVTYTVPGTQVVQQSITATGSLAARYDIPVGVVGEGGRVTAVLVQAGDWVRQGQVLVSIDRSVQMQQIAALEASVSAARANLNLAQANLDRSTQLVARGFISKADIDRLTATRDAASAQVRVAQAQLGERRASTARLSILAPKSGYVLERNVEPGQTVSPGSPALFRIAQNGELELQAQLSENELAQMSVGTPAEVTPVGTDKSFAGQIWQLAPLIDTQSRQGIARIALSYDPALRPGGFASATIRSGTRQASVLPESAILSDAKGQYVYVIDKNNKVARRGVTIDGVTSAGIIVTSGLSGNERIVLFAGGFLNPGELVKPRTQKADPLAKPEKEK